MPQRLATDQRRAQLLSAGVELLSSRAFDEVSIADIAAKAGVSKGLLYHYFPTKSAFVVAVLEAASQELAAITVPDPGLTPLAQIDSSLDAFLGFVENHERAYAAIFRSRGAAADSAIQNALERARRERTEAVIVGLARWPDVDERRLRDSAPLSIALQGWVFFVEGAVLAWLEQAGIERDDLRQLLRRQLISALAGAGSIDQGLGLPSLEEPGT